MIKISVTKIRRTNLNKLAALGRDLKVAMTGDIFKGKQPLTPEELDTLITNFTTAQSNAESGGKLAIPAYLAATLALKNGIALFGPYVDMIAKGDVVILALTPMPTTARKDFVALILAGALAAGLISKKGMSGQFITDCKSYGPKVGYFAIISEGIVLPKEVTLSSKGQLFIPLECNINIFTSITTTKRKTFSNLKPGTTYYVYYVLTYGPETVGFLEKPLEVICSN